MSKLSTLPNMLSALRIPLALAFLSSSPQLRVCAVLAAMGTDVLDGFLARRWNQKSQLGAALDPLADKFFALFACLVFINEGRLSWLEMAMLASRDFAVLVFGLYLCLSRHWSSYQVNAIWSGKVTTALQFIVLITLTLGGDVPPHFFPCFILLGLCALAELCINHHRAPVTGHPHGQ